MVNTFSPKTLSEALDIRSGDRVIPFAGGTDLMVRRRSWSGTLPRFDYPVLFLNAVGELQGVAVENEKLLIGAGTSLTSLLDNPQTPVILKKAIRKMASPAIRNRGTLGGNICNASPAADTLPPLYAMDASIILQNKAGRRELPIETFLLGPGRTGLSDDELLTYVIIPLRNYSAVYYKKVGTRKADSLAKVSLAGLAKINNGKIETIRLAIGAVAPTVIRSRQIETMLIGESSQCLSRVIPEILQQYEPFIQPIDDQRSSANYRKQAALGLIEDFLQSLAKERNEG